MEAVPGLRESRDDRRVILSIDDVGRALFVACENSMQDEKRILSKTAKLIRKHLLQSSDEIFNGNTSLERHKASVPDSLTTLISMVLEGGSADRDISGHLRKIASNVGQLIRFNTVKQTRNQNITKFRHSTKNEPAFPVELALMLQKQENEN